MLIGEGIEKAEISLKVLKPSNFSVPHIPLGPAEFSLEVSKHSSFCVHPLSIPGILLMLSVTSSRWKRAKEQCWRGFSTEEKEFICRSKRAFLTVGKQPHALVAHRMWGTSFWQGSFQELPKCCHSSPLGNVLKEGIMSQESLL